ncbi:MAG: hypothetical protein AAGJ52_14975, partial [Pseudomonadota bacterium]
MNHKPRPILPARDRHKKIQIFRSFGRQFDSPNGNPMSGNSNDEDVPAPATRAFRDTIHTDFPLSISEKPALPTKTEVKMIRLTPPIALILLASSLQAAIPDQDPDFS